MAAIATDLADEKADEENRDPQEDVFRKPFAKMNIVKPIVPPVVQAPVNRVAPPSVPPPSLITWSLKGSVTFSTDNHIEPVKFWSQRSISRPLYTASFDGNNRTEDLGEQLFYYQFPFPSISQAQRRKISGLLLRPRRTKDATVDAESKAELEYYQSILGSWRKAFLSLYEALKAVRGSYFYYFQHDFGALFRNQDGLLDAVLCKCHDGVMGALDREGIQYEVSGGMRPDAQEPIEAEMAYDMDADQEEGEEVEQEDEDDEDEDNKEQIRAEISDRIKRRKLKNIHKRTLNQGTLRIIDVHGFVDYLLNQKHGRSYVILPELVSPLPFLMGTCCKNEMAVHGADVNGVGRVRISGVLMPSAVAAVRKGVEGLLGSSVNMSSEVDPRTSTLSQLHY